MARVRSEAELAVLMAKARERLRPGQEPLDLVVAGAPATGRPGVITGKRSALLWQVLSGVYDRLGFDVVGNDAFKQLVLARIIEPTSKADSLRVLDEIGVEHASLRTMFRSQQRSGVGYSKERRVDPQVVVGLLVDWAGSRLWATPKAPPRMGTTVLVNVAA